MPNRNSKRLVIDTSVTSAAGGENATHPTPKQCRECLEGVLKHKHYFVITDDIWEEWKRHRSNFASEWLTSMRARRLIHRLSDVTNNHLRAKIEQHSENEIDKEAMLKDIHLIEAALETDNLIISLNTLDRRRFQTVSVKIREIRAIIWVNPDLPEEESLLWLENNCPLEEHRQLGYVSGE